MTSPSGTGSDAVRRLAEAASWRAHLTENDLESTSAFEAWLADSRNRDAWDSVQRSWNLFGEHATSPELLDLRRHALGKVRAVGRERWASRHPWFSGFRRMATIAALVVLTLSGGLLYQSMRAQTYLTEAGERRTVTLADGSEVVLDSLSELRVDYSRHARDLKLIKGQARFDVVHDVERPFSVLAAGKKVVATGTVFTVDLLAKELFVTLLEGKVIVLPQAGSASEPVVESIELAAGQLLAVAEDGSSTVTPVSVQRVTAWQAGKLEFDNEPLSSVVMRVNRYAPRPIHLMDENVAGLRVSGVFNTGDVDGFVATITHYLPIAAERRDNAIYLSSRSGDSRVPAQPR